MILPIKIEPCPIAEAVVEVRFDPSVFENAVFGIIYNSLKNVFDGEVQSLPILQLPEQLRAIDPNLKNKPHYLIKSEKGYTIQIGTNVIIIGASIPYPGWKLFFKEIKDVFETIADANVVKSINRVGLRYVNFFPHEIFDEIDIDIHINGELIVPQNTLFRTEIDQGGFKNTLQVSNNASQNKSGKVANGSIIDIDTYKDFDSLQMNSELYECIGSAHVIEKSVLFGLFKEDFLTKLKPKYDDSKK